MKLATQKNNTRDGQLLVVSKDLTRATTVTDIALTMQQAIDGWHEITPKLAKVYQYLNENLNAGFKLDIKTLAAPLPRAYQWLDGSAYLNHAELLRRARGVEVPEIMYKEPLMYQGVSDNLLGPIAEFNFKEEWGIDYEAEIVVVTTDVPMGITKQQVSEKIILVGLINDISLRNLIFQELQKGFGFIQSKPANSFSPVFVTLDEIDEYWHENKIHLPLESYVNGKLFGEPNAGKDMFFDFADLIIHATKTRSLSAGTIIGSGTVSNYAANSGVSCIAEQRAKDIIEFSREKTPFLKHTDSVRIEMFDKNRQSIFGAIENYF